MPQEATRKDHSHEPSQESLDALKQARQRVKNRNARVGAARIRKQGLIGRVEASWSLSTEDQEDG